MWTITDYTNEMSGGYLRIALDGRRVVDAFPYARDADPEWVREQAQRIVDVMNRAATVPPPDAEPSFPERVLQAAREAGLEIPMRETRAGEIIALHLRRES